MAQVFISYSSRDRAKAEALRTALGTAGVDVWWDQKLIPGSTFPRVIADEIDRAACTVVLCSGYAMASRWVLAEATYADQKMVPVIIEQDAKLIPPLNGVEGARLLDWEQSPPAPEFDLLLEKIRTAVSTAPREEPASPSKVLRNARREHSSAWGRLVHEQLQNRWHDDGVAPPYLETAGQFLTDEPWHAWVERRIREGSDIAADDPKLGSLHHALGQVDCRNSYPEILTSLRDVVSDRHQRTISMGISDVRQALNRLEEAAAHPGRTDEDTERILEEREGCRKKQKSLENLQRIVRDLTAQVREPEFRRCFLVTGFPGSGKTHLIASLLKNNTDPEKDPAALFVVLEEATGVTLPLEQLLLESAVRATGHPWPALEELDAFLENTYDGTRLVFILDDLERWQARRPGFADELADWIYNRNLRCVYWIITINPARYDEIARSAGRWSELAWSGLDANENPYPGLSGWLDLDQVNREELIGLAVLRNELFRNEPDEEPAPEASQQQKRLALEYLNRTELDDTVRRNLASPFLAWIMAELQGRLQVPLDQAISLNFVEFIEKYQNLRIQELTSEYKDLLPRHFEQAIWLIADLLARTGELQPFFNDVQRYLVQQSTEGHFDLAPAAIAEHAITGLGDMNILAVMADSQQGGVRRLEPRFEPFWQFHLARSLAQWEEARRQDQRAFVDSLEIWLGIAKSSVISAEGVLEFLLLQVTGALRPDGQLGAFQEALWLEPLRNEKLPSAAPWFAAPRAPGQAQKLLAKEALRGGPLPQERRDLFGLMHFCAEAEPEAFSVPQRLGLLQPRFGRIHEEGLQDYYLYVARRLFAGVQTPDQLREAMLCFAGCEVMSLAESLSDLSVDAIDDLNANHESATEFLMGFLQADAHVAQIEADAYRQHRPRAEHRDSDGEYRHFYREWLIHDFLEGLVARWGIEAYDLLSAHQWFRPPWGGRSPTSFYLRREFNFALGHWYRTRHRKEERADYVELVKRLVDSRSPGKRETAFYLIRHSTITGGMESVAVERAFHPMLREIYTDPRVTVPEGLFRVNLTGFEELRQERLRQGGRLYKSHPNA